MIVDVALALLVVALAGVSCLAAWPERRGRPLRRWRPIALPLPIAASAVVLLLVPPSNDLRHPEVWMLGLLGIVAGLLRAATIRLRTDYGNGYLLLRQASEGFWVALFALALIVVDVVAEPFGVLYSAFVQIVELILVVLATFLLARNIALLVRSRDVPHHGL